MVGFPAGASPSPEISVLNLIFISSSSIIVTERERRRREKGGGFLFLEMMETRVFGRRCLLKVGEKKEEMRTFQGI